MEAMVLTRIAPIDTSPLSRVVGIVDALGPGCHRFSVGRRVGVAWLRHA